MLCAMVAMNSICGGAGRARAGARLPLGAARGPRATARAGPLPTLTGLCTEEASARHGLYGWASSYQS